MKISEKQILHLMQISRRYFNVCQQMNWLDHVNEVRKLLDAIYNQQSSEIKEIE